MPITKKTHFNPCLWTALWNKVYYESFLANKQEQLKSREQEISTLKIVSNKIIRVKTQNVFFEKHTGIATVSKEVMIDYAKKYFPEEVSTFQKMKEEELALTHDFEDHFSILEKSFDCVFKLIRSNKIESISDKAELSHFIFSHQLRNPLYLNELIKSFTESGGSKLEALMHLKHHVLGNSENLKKFIFPIVSRKWTVYKSSRYIPMGDCPIMFRKNNIYVIVSPHILIRVYAQGVLPDIPCKYKNINYFQYTSLLKLIVDSSFNEIIADDDSLLKSLQKSVTFKNKLKKTN